MLGLQYAHSSVHMGNVLVVGTDTPEPILYYPVLMGRVGFVTWWECLGGDGPGPL